jgi:ATP:cob(I)alamin adenosyltransferase
MIYTKIENNQTKELFDRTSKVLEELNASLGYAKTFSGKNILTIETKDVPYEEILNVFQQDVLCIKEALAGSDVQVSKKHLDYLEKIIREIDAVLPSINSDIIYGGGKTSTYLNVTRFKARRAERLVAKLKKQMNSDDCCVFLNRLSNALYALARFANYQEGYSEKAPLYH